MRLDLLRAVHELCDPFNTGAELVNLKSDARKVKFLVVLTLRSSRRKCQMRSAIMGVEPVLIRIVVVNNGKGSKADSTAAVSCSKSMSPANTSRIDWEP